MPLASLLWLDGGMLALGVIALVLLRLRSASTLVYGSALLLCGAAASVAGLHLLTGADRAQQLTLPLGIPWMGAHFRLDALSAFFLAVVNLGGAITGLYAVGHARHDPEAARVLPFYGPFLAAMNLVVLADDAFTFLLAWELMSLTSWALVLSHHKSKLNERAGFVYLVMASFGTMVLLLAFGVLAGVDGAYVFDQMRARPPVGATAALALVLTLAGAGSKAGLVPLHVWLPLAHPAAPSHVSALMSGVMTKVAVYGLIRITFDLMGVPAWWWSAWILTIGGATATLGVLYAVMQDDLKRLLAYSSVENIGVVLIGLGLAMAFRADGATSAAAIALTAALFHVLNHSLFKTLLFFGAGAVVGATGERDMGRLGGLIHRMPGTALAFLVGAVGISALPPLNGFASEWLTFQAILVSPQLTSWTLRFLVPAIGALLALSAALAAACFVKAVGITFLGRPRSEAAREAREADRFSVSAMLILATLCTAAGLFPGVVIDALAPVSEYLIATRVPVQAALPWFSVVPIAEGRSSYSALLVFAFIAVSMLLAVAAIHRLASRAVRRSPAWDCGFPTMRPDTQYTPASIAQPIRRVFGTLVFAAKEVVTIPPPGDLGPARLRLRLYDLIWLTFYAPIGRIVAVLSRTLNRFQFLTVRSYLSLVFGLLVLLLLVVVLRQ